MEFSETVFKTIIQVIQILKFETENRFGKHSNILKVQQKVVCDFYLFEVIREVTEWWQSPGCRTTQSDDRHLGQVALLYNSIHKVGRTNVDPQHLHTATW